MRNKELLSRVVRSADDSKAIDIQVLDMNEVNPIADYFVICQASNERQVQAIARNIKKDLEKMKVNLKRLEGFNEGRWILIDATDIIVHVFHEEERSHYNLERLWGDANFINYEDLI